MNVKYITRRFAAPLPAILSAVGLLAVAGGVPGLSAPAGASGTVAPLAITTTSLPDVHIYAKYKTVLTADGGKKPYKWTLADGALPPGLKLTKAGKIVGAPTALGAFSVEVTVTDSTKPTPNVATASLSVTVDAMSVDTSRVPGVALADKPYKGKLTTDGGRGRRVWSLASGALPPGLKLTPSGALSGTPGFPGTYSFDVLVQDSVKPDPDMAGATITIVIAV